MAKKKEETKVEVNPDVFMGYVEKKLADAVCINEDMRPVVECLEEFGITGIRMVQFIMRLADLTAKHKEQQLDVDELIEEA